MSPVDSVLSVRSLTKRYDDFELSEVSFEIPKGYIMGLVGPNGAGKTTTLKSILGLLRRDGGEIRLAGIDPAQDGAKARAGIGFVHDDPSFPRHLTLRQIARLVGRFYENWQESVFARLADAFGLALQKRFGTLSRGSKMRFALALALSHRATLILLDEPTAGLDPVFRRDLLDLLQEQLQHEETSILFSTHITSDLDRIADYITLLQEGRVVFSESKEQILDRWSVLKGGLDLLPSLRDEWILGIQRDPHGFEAITDQAGLIKELFGDAIVIERPTLEEIILLTSAGMTNA